VTKGTKSHIQIETVQDSRIVCFTVPNEILVTRRKGKVAIQGNTKHAAHLIRLMRQGWEMMSTGQVNVRRPDAEELLAIRNKGIWSYDTLIAFAEKMDAKMDVLYNSGDCKLPKVPDIEFLDKLCMSVVDGFLTEHG